MAEPSLQPRSQLYGHLPFLDELFKAHSVPVEPGLHTGHVTPQPCSSSPRDPKGTLILVSDVDFREARGSARFLLRSLVHGLPQTEAKRTLMSATVVRATESERGGMDMGSTDLGHGSGSRIRVTDLGHGSGWTQEVVSGWDPGRDRYSDLLGKDL